jgi:hypothetical protein
LIESDLIAAWLTFKRIFNMENKIKPNNSNSFCYSFMVDKFCYRTDVCPVKIGPSESGVKRAGASAEYFAGN